MELTVAAVVVAVVAAIKDLVPNLTGNLTRLVAVGVGAVLGYLHLAGASDPVSGAVMGLVAVGVVSVADRTH